MEQFVKTVILIILVLAITSFSQIPRTMSYQGMLLDNAGQPLSVTETLTFKFYDVPSGGTELWQETKVVEINDGIFNVILGSDTPLNLSFDLTYYLGITVGVSGTELQPRIELTSSAYALNAKTVEDSSITTEKIAPNQVVKSINSLTDSVQLVEGSNITIVSSRNSLTISADVSGAAGNTLDQAYDQGGTGVGRTIIADSGPFEVSGIDGALFSGTYLSGSIPYEGEGARMMWYPGKAAFRAGGLSSGRSTFWNNDSIGNYSLAFGYNTKAKGSYSTAMGWTTNASGSVSSALGHSTIASGYASTAMGRSTTASGENSTAMGRGIEVSGDYSFGIALSDQRSINVTQDSTLAIMGGNVGIGTTTPDYPLSMSPGNALGGLHIEQIKTSNQSATYGINVYLQDNYTGDSFATGIRSYAVNNGGGIYMTTGVYGIAEGSTHGRLYGVRGSAWGDDGIENFGVYGFAGGTNGSKYGVYGTVWDWGLGWYAVYADGDLAYTGNLIQTSDKKLKKNEQNLSGILPKLMRIQPKSFSFRKDEYKYMNLADGLHFGLIAQELEEVFPELVVGAIHPSKQDEKGNQLSEQIQYKGIKSMELIPLLVQGMKEQQEIIESLQKRIEKLEKK